MTYPRRPPPPPLAYTLHTDPDGFIYVYNAGTQESRKAFRPTSQVQKRALDDLVEILNDSGSKVTNSIGPVRALYAYQLMLMIW